MRSTLPAALLLASLPALLSCSGGPVIKGIAAPDPVLSTATVPPGAFDPSAGIGRSPTGATVRFVNPFAPETLRIHPLTRFTTDPVDGDPRIDAHIELFDTHLDPVKALGIVTFQLYRDDASASGSPVQLQRWQVDLTDPAANAAPYDRVTRTYRLSLRGVPESISQSTRLMLLAQFTTPEGRTLSATHRF